MPGPVRPPRLRDMGMVGPVVGRQGGGGVNPTLARLLGGEKRDKPPAPQSGGGDTQTRMLGHFAGSSSTTIPAMPDGKYISTLQFVISTPPVYPPDVRWIRFTSFVNGNRSIMFDYQVSPIDAATTTTQEARSFTSVLTGGGGWVWSISWSAYMASGGGQVSVPGINVSAFWSGTPIG